MVTEMNLTTAGIPFVLNTGEEGLGNLKGVRQVMEDYKGRVSRLFAIDGNYRKVGERRGGFQTVPHGTQNGGRPLLRAFLATTTPSIT